MIKNSFDTGKKIEENKFKNFLKKVQKFAKQFSSSAEINSMSLVFHQRKVVPWKVSESLRNIPMDEVHKWYLLKNFSFRDNFAAVAKPKIRRWNFFGRFDLKGNITFFCADT